MDLKKAHHCSIMLRKSKTDQYAQGKCLYISSKTAQDLIKWLSKIDRESGPIFIGINRAKKLTKRLSEGQVNRIHKSIAKKAMLDPNIVNKISGHSMRAGAAQDLVSSGASLAVLMSMGRWRKSDTIMRYVERITHLI